MGTVIDMLDTVLLSVAIIVLIVAVMLFGGEPDLADSLMSHLDKHTELLSCQKP